jgi:Cu(I)/Ag(I) efflux system membrane fusion protein
VDKNILASLALFLTSAVALWGCNNAATPPANSPPTVEAEHNDHGDQEHAGAPAAAQTTSDAANADVIASLAELPADDRALAEQQKVCPVSGELLGSMGAPIKIAVKGQPVFICCEGCKEELLAKPDEYLAKLKK